MDPKLIAQTINRLRTFTLPPLDSWGEYADAVRVDLLIEQFADTLATIVPNFNRAAFIAACNAKEEL